VATKESSTDSSSGGSPSASGRFARWLASWRVAIRIARRDARRYKWRSALIVVMVGLPVLLLTSGITLVATQNVSLAESVPPLMGSSQARIAGDSLTTSTVQRLTGGTVIQIIDGSMRITRGDRRPSMSALGIDARDPIARGMTELVSGRWATTTAEIVVTEAGIAGGLPREGTLTAGPEGTKAGLDSQPRQLRIGGVATAQTQGGMPYLVALPELVGGMSEPETSSAAYLLGRADPVTWSDVRALKSRGLTVQSREVFRNPSPDAQADPMAGENVNESDQRQLDLVLLLATVCLFIETTLLAGPAFAVSAARQRRSLALAASNGADSRQLRRYVLGQAVVLGVGSAAVAAVAGLLLALAGLTWWKGGHPDFVTGPFDVPWPQVVGVLSCSAVASMVAALLPARGIARLDIVSVLAGRSGDRTIHRGLPVAGALLMVGSGGGDHLERCFRSWGCSRSRRGERPVVVSLNVVSGRRGRPRHRMPHGDPGAAGRRRPARRPPGASFTAGRARYGPAARTFRAGGCLHHGRGRHPDGVEHRRGQRHTSEGGRLHAFPPNGCGVDRLQQR
jgi:putative ABC transport system permease protein